jgi:NAD-dependent deacetylase
VDSEAIDLVRRARKITAFTGAGTSTDSGIPDFRGPRGIWTKDPDAERLSTLSAYLADPDVRRRSWQNRLAHPAWDAVPNAAHRALVRLQQDGRLHALVTQNIDGLHQRAGSVGVLELHGSLFRTRCTECGALGDMRAALQRVSDGDADPPCVLCGGILKSATISFGEALDATLLDRARRLAAESDLVLAIGTTLSVQPAASVAGDAARQGTPLVICNADATPYDGIATHLVRGPVAETVPALLAEAA